MRLQQQQQGDNSFPTKELSTSGTRGGAKANHHQQIYQENSASDDAGATTCGKIPSKTTIGLGAEKDRLELKDFKEKIQTKRFLPDDFKGSTFGISNLGMMGIKQFDAMINRSDSGIAAIGSEDGGKVAITLTMDHRIINGYQAAEFMNTLKRLVLDADFYRDAKD